MADEQKPNQGWRREAGQQSEIGDMLVSARSISRQMIARAKEQSDQILRAAREEAAEIISEAEREADQIRRSARAEAETMQPAVSVSPEMQEYAVHCVESCMTSLRKHQLEALELINEQWQQFLCGIMLPGGETGAREDAAEDTEAPPKGDSLISSAEIAQKVSAIARELGEFPGGGE